MPEYPYTWRWGTCGGKYPAIGKRKGQRCTIIVRGAMNSCAVMFEDGTRFIASRNGLRKDNSR